VKASDVCHFSAFISGMEDNARKESFLLSFVTLSGSHTADAVFALGCVMIKMPSTILPKPGDA
jgi:hypothetical protein